MHRLRRNVREKQLTAMQMQLLPRHAPQNKEAYRARSKLPQKEGELMLFYLGIVAEDDLIAGNIVPSYVLCRSHGSSSKRSGMRVIKQTPNSKLKSMNKVLVTSITDNDALIDFLCSYRTRDHMHGDKHYDHEKTKKYYPKGGLFWFECNEYGEKTGAAIFIKKVPDVARNGKTDYGFTEYKEKTRHVPTVSQILSKEPNEELYAQANIKPKTYVP